MTTYIGAPCEASTRGERLLYQRIKLAFDNEPSMYCYVEPAIGSGRPDLVLLDPGFGAVIFEVKDYAEAHLVEISKTEPWRLVVNGADQPCPNPFTQVYQYFRVAQYYFDARSFHQAVVLPGIASTSEWGRAIVANTPARVAVFFKDDMRTRATFLGRFNAAIPRQPPLAPDLFKLLRANLLPTCRLPTTYQSRFRLDEPILEKDTLELLDAEQEKLACGLGDGHRLFFGVAGSGKTIILVARARYLARKHPDWRILIVCYNKLLAASLASRLNPQDYRATIIIENYHRLAASIISAAGPPCSTEYAVAQRDAGQDLTRFFNEQVPLLFTRAVREANPQKFDAILVDEAQDFEPTWYAPLLGLLNPATRSLLVTLDGLQGIYARKHIHWSGVGISARGRVVKLQKAYRNPAEIGKAAASILPKSLTDLVGTGDEFLETAEYARSGGQVEVILAHDKAAGLEQVAAKAKECLDRNWSILISFRQNISKFGFNHPIHAALARQGIPQSAIASGGPASNLISIATPQSAKGLEADAVIIPNADEYTTSDELQLLYVAMTRATRVVMLVGCKMTPVLDRIKPGFKKDE